MNLVILGAVPERIRLVLDRPLLGPDSGLEQQGAGDRATKRLETVARFLLRKLLGEGCKGA